MIIKIIFSVFILFVLARIIYRAYKKQITKRETLLWFVFWVLVEIAAVFPFLTDELAELVGVGRGLDLVLPVAVAVAFYLIFRIVVKIDRMDKNITQIVRQVAINKAEKNEPQKNDKDNQ